MSGSPPASRTSAATHCVCKGMHLPHNNTLQSFGISDLMLQSTSPSFSFSPGFSFEPSIELGQEAMLQRPTNPDSLQTVCEPWNFDMPTTAVQDDTLTYTDYLEQTQVDAISIAGVHTPDSAIVGVNDLLISSCFLSLSFSLICVTELPFKFFFTASSTYSCIIDYPLSAFIISALER